LFTSDDIIKSVLQEKVILNVLEVQLEFLNRVKEKKFQNVPIDTYNRIYSPIHYLFMKETI